MEILIEAKKSLKNWNTFGVDVLADFFVKLKSIDELKFVLKKFKDTSKLFLGGGSNLLFTQNFEGVVIAPHIKGKKIVSSLGDLVLVEAKAGENWDEFVAWAVEKKLGGLENLSLIPGNVGTCPIQNIGAYGTEIKDCFVSLTAVNIKTQETKIFTKEACNFGYRDSVFKKSEKGNWVIVSVVFALQKNASVNVSYGAIQSILDQENIKNPTILDVRNAVISIRSAKLPDPKKIGNAGSFFKNPIIPTEKFLEIQQKNPSMPFYKVDNYLTKIPAGWLIDQLGWKGKKLQTVGVHEQQALVLINLGNATGEEVLFVAKKIQASVLESFNIDLEIEVNIC